MESLFRKRNQLHWLVLLALAVGLPTVSLLWFMSRVIANERLVVQEKLRVLYRDRLVEATAKADSVFETRLDGLNAIDPPGNPYALFNRMVLEEHLQGVVIWDADGGIVYPQTAASLGNDFSTRRELAEAWNAEFARRDAAEAAELYAQLASSGDPALALVARTGQARCLARLGQLDKAIAQCQKAAFETLPESSDDTQRLPLENARLLLLSLLKQAGPSPANTELFKRTAEVLLVDLYNTGGERALLPANQNLFIAQKVLDALKAPFALEGSEARARLETLVAAERLSITAAESLRPFAGQFDAVFHTQLGDTSAYGLRHQNPDATLLLLLSDKGIASWLAGYDVAFRDTEAACRILDAAGAFVAGVESPEGEAFNAASLPPGFPGWKVELYFQGGDVFKRAADRQIAVYTWTGFLVILLILIVGGFATRAIGRQIRLNEMKNDFIATVSHELKTPLASMRVLVDTLLEGNVKDEAQVTRYLQLTARENERLSRMIDNFLTFSRMERNKVAFNVAEARPAAIAADAVEAVKTKYETHHCRLDLQIADPLPDIQADHDAVVTALVNLLDNACKYTGEDKQVTLRLHPEDDAVCFAVSDNGIGMARRHLRRIFDRFYQVDSSLARRAEGCGLGLSIVKFIIDAHHGKIIVDSRPGAGSTFTLRLPVARGNGHGNGG